MKKTVFAFSVALIIASLPLAVHAADRNGYLVLKGGLFDPSANDLDNFGTGYNAEIGMGGYFIPRILALELGVGAFRSKDSDQKVDTVPILLTAKGSLPIGNLEPYAEAGVGWYFVRTRGAGFDDDDSVAGYHVGLGLNVEVVEGIFLGVEGRHLWAKPEILGRDIKIDGYSATANLGFRF